MCGKWSLLKRHANARNTSHEPQVDVAQIVFCGFFSFLAKSVCSFFFQINNVIIMLVMLFVTSFRLKFSRFAENFTECLLMSCFLHPSINGCLYFFLKTTKRSQLIDYFPLARISTLGSLCCDFLAETENKLHAVNNIFVL